MVIQGVICWFFFPKWRQNEGWDFLLISHLNTPAFHILITPQLTTSQQNLLHRLRVDFAKQIQTQVFLQVLLDDYPGISLFASYNSHNIFYNNKFTTEFVDNIIKVIAAMVSSN